MKTVEPTIVDKLQKDKRELAGRITELHFSRNPGLEKKYGEKGRERCYEDAVFHLNYLIEAVRFESKELFNHYLEWAWNMLEARDIPLDDLVSNLGFIEQVISEKYSSSEIESVLHILETGIEHIKNLEPKAETYILPENPLHEEAGEYLSLLLEAKRDKAAELIDELVQKNIPVDQIYENIFQATQYEVGVLWQQNKINVANEHYCTAATQLIMSRLYPLIFSNKKNGLKLVACSVSRELHELGIRMVADFFEMDGWDTYYMGSNMPDAHLIQALRENEANLLAISVTLPMHIGKVKELIRNIREMDEFSHLKIMAGGYPFGIVPELSKSIGADATAKNARQAVLKANSMLY